MMLLGSLNYALALGVGVTFLLAGLVAAAQLHTFRNLAGIEITPLAAGETFAGGSIAFTLALHAGSAARTDIRVTRRHRGSGRRHRRRPGADGDARRARAGSRPRRARPRHADVELSVRTLARLGVRALSTRRHRVSRRRRSAFRRCRAAMAAPIRWRRARATTPISPACANSSAAIRRSASRGKPSRAAPAGSPRNSTAQAAAARSCSPGTSCRRRLPSKRGCRA